MVENRLKVESRSMEKNEFSVPVAKNKGHTYKRSYWYLERRTLNEKNKKNAKTQYNNKKTHIYLGRELTQKPFKTLGAMKD